ncbi:MAG: GerW family sporulation protein [Bacillota bacterium]
MGYHPIESLMRTTMESLKDMVDVNTVVGEPVETKEGTVIIPVSKVSFGFVTGGGDECGMGDSGQGDSGGGGQGQEDEDGQSGYGMASYQQMPFTGGTGAGVSVRPVGFLVVGTRKVRFLPVDSRALVDRLLEEAPELLDRFTSWLDRGCREDETELAGGGESGEGEEVPRSERYHRRRARRNGLEE